MHTVVETDLESDDLILMQGHADRYTDTDLTVIVGEAEPWKKIPLAVHFYSVIGHRYRSVTIVQGFPSSKSYPIPDGQYLGGPEPDSTETIEENYRKAYADCEVAFMIKPPREAMKFKLPCKETIVYCYGSFNWRTLDLPLQEYIDLMARYQAFFYVDSFGAIGEQNSALLREPIAPSDHVIRKVTAAWNEHIVAEQTAKLCTPGLSEDKIKRAKKIIDNASKNMDRQYVLADVCILLLITGVPDAQLRPVSLVAVAPYTVWKDDPESNVHVFIDEGKDIRRKRLMELVGLYSGQ